MDIYKYIENNDNDLKELNVIDVIIFTRLSYFHIENLSLELPIKLLELSNYIKEMRLNQNDTKLINLLTDSKRYQNIEIKRFKYIEDKEKEEVFKAITIKLPNNSTLISFRGTGKNPLDFKEDMNMSYMIIPSCFEAVRYLEEEKGCGKLYLSGHSKGGHLAMYAGSHTTFFNRIRIEKIFNFDGPGFESVTKELRGFHNKIINYFPESSIVGRIMNSVGEINAIKTKKEGIEAHNIYNWEIKENSLVPGKLSSNSDMFHEECLNILKVISKRKREIAINYIFSLMLKGELKNIREIDLAGIKRLINDVPHLDDIEKEELMKFFKILIKCSMPELIHKKEKE